MNMSNITQNEVPIISSKAKEIIFCGNNTSDLSLYPGQKFTIPLKALGQANSTVPATVFWVKNNDYPQQPGEYRLSPSSGIINGLCTAVSFWLYASDLDLEWPYIFFKLYSM